MWAGNMSDYLEGNGLSLSQVSSSVLMGKNASHKSKCVTGKMTVRTNLMKLTAQL